MSLRDFTTSSKPLSIMSSPTTNVVPAERQEQAAPVSNATPQETKSKTILRPCALLFGNTVFGGGVKFDGIIHIALVSTCPPGQDLWIGLELFFPIGPFNEDNGFGMIHHGRSWCIQGLIYLDG